MLIQFTCQNWMSYRERACLYLIASDEDRERSTLAHIPSIDANILPLAGIWGGNSSGKTNLLKGLRFVRDWVVTGQWQKPSTYIHSTSAPACFEVSFEAPNDTAYCLHLSSDSFGFCKEKLFRLTPGDDELLYELEGSQASTARSQYPEVHNWFANILTFYNPNEAVFCNLPYEQLLKHLNWTLPRLDTGIACLESVELAPPPTESSIEEGCTALIPFQGETILLSCQNGTHTARKLVAGYSTEEGQMWKNSLSQEASGTKSLVHFLPLLFECALGTRKVFIIDDLGSSWHPNLSEHLLNAYVQYTHKDTRQQLIFTTHTASLMGSMLFRQDELWLTESDQNTSTLSSAAQFGDHLPKQHLADSYLWGTIGGTPHLNLTLFPADAED